MTARNFEPWAGDELSLAVDEPYDASVRAEHPPGGDAMPGQPQVARLSEELRRTRAALARSEARYRRLNEQAPVMMHSIDREGRIVVVSDMWLATLGYCRDEVLGRLSTDFLTEVSGRRAPAAVLPGQLPTAGCQNVPFQAVKRNGEVMDVLLSAVAERDAAGEALRSITVLVDVTERKRAEAQLRFSEARLRALSDNSPLVILMKDLDGRYVIVNREFERVYRLTETEVVGKTVFELFSSEAAADFDRHDREVIESGVASRREHVTGSGDSARIWSAVKFPVVNTAGETVGVGSLESDITQQKQAEDALRAAKEQAETANRTKSEFLANMSHELRTPLNAIIGFSEIMRDQLFGPLGSPRYRDYAQDIYRSGSLLLEVINDILDLSKIEAGRLELYEEACDLGELVDGALRLTRERARIQDIRLDRLLPTNLPGLYVDRRLFTQILLNLLSNAIKFTPPHGSIIVSAALAEDDALVVRVADSGIGIAPCDIVKALEPFGQVENAMSRKHGGTGLGLPLSKGLAELHGGRLKVESTVGAGTTVSIRLPAARLVAAGKPS